MKLFFRRDGLSDERILNVGEIIKTEMNNFPCFSKMYGVFFPCCDSFGSSFSMEHCHVEYSLSNDNALFEERKKMLMESCAFISTSKGNHWLRTINGQRVSDIRIKAPYFNASITNAALEDPSFSP